MVRPVSPPRIARVLLALAAAAAATGARATLWVSPAGDDEDPGTEEHPLRTIGRARDVVRTLNHDMADDITVFIAGTHHLDQPLEFGPEDSGTNGFNVVYTAAPGEHPVVTGGTRVAGWTPSDPERNLWSAPEPEGLSVPVDLFVNGTPAARTRGRLLPVFSRNPDEASAAAPGPKAHWKNPDDVAFEPQEQGAIWSERTGAREAFVANAFELLGTPGEWYLDRAGRRFYYTPRAGEQMASADVEAASAPGLIAGVGTKERPIAGIVFKGIRFEYTAQRRAGTRPKIVPQAAVRFTYAAAIQFLEDDFLHMDTPALELGPVVEGCTVDGCMFADISWSAAALSWASATRIAESRFSYVATSPFAGAEPDGTGVIVVTRSDDISIEHDQIDHYPAIAIDRDAASATGAREASNLISSPMIPFHGAGAGESAPAPSGDLGLPLAYHALADEAFASPTTPHPPTAVSAEGEDGFAYVTWIPPCVDGGSPVTSYTVASSSGAKATVASADFLAKGYLVFGGLENGLAVTFSVAATNANGASPPSLPTAAVIIGHKRKLKQPQAPAAVSLTTGGAGLGVRITPPAADGGSPVIAYVVAASPAGPQAVLEGLDVIRADATQPVTRILEGIFAKGASAVSISARNVAGLGKPLIINIKK